MGSYIKIDRKILDWEWYSDINTCRLFIHMLLKANWKDGRFEGKVIQRGSFVSSYTILENETKLTNREIRTEITHLKKTGELTVKTTNRYSIFTINNYNQYQVADSKNDRQGTVKRHSNDILTSAIEEYIIDDGVIDIYAHAKNVAHDLIKKYWGRNPTDTDIDNVYGLIIKVNVQERKAYIDENKKELLEYAFQSSSNANAMNWNYVNGVMSNLMSREIKTIDEAYEFDIKRKS